MAVALYIANAFIGIYSFIAVICFFCIYRIVRRHHWQVLMQHRVVQNFSTRENAHNMESEKHIAFNTLHFTFVLVSVTFRRSFAVFLMVATFFLKTQLLTFLH